MARPSPHLRVCLAAVQLLHPLVDTPPEADSSNGRCRTGEDTGTLPARAGTSPSRAALARSGQGRKAMATISSELTTKLATIRAALAEAGAVGVRLRGVDWFAWATCGGSNVVILTTETGVAEVFVTLDGAWILTDQLEAGRLEAEEIPPGYEIWAGPWIDLGARQTFVENIVK